MNSAQTDNDNPIFPNTDSTASGAAEDLARAATIDHVAASDAMHPAEPPYRDVSTRTADASTRTASDASGAASVASGAASAASALADSGHEKLSQAAAGLSEQIRKLSSYFENCGIDEVIGDARRLVQRNPALFVAGGVVVGFALSRVLSSLEHSRPSRRH